MARLKELTLLGATLTFIGGCGTVLGLGEYEIDEDAAVDGDGDGDGTGGTDTGSGGGDGDGTGGADTGSGGDVMTGTGGATTGECDAVGECDDDNDCTTDACIDNECAHTTISAGEACSGGVCDGVTGSPSCVRCIDDAAGDAQDTGCGGGAPRCDESDTPTCTGCDTHSDCDDGNDCTVDTCNSKDECVITPEAAGTSCSGGACNGVEGAEVCEVCVNDQTGATEDAGCGGATPLCDEDATNRCEACLDDAADADVDTGCDSSTPICNESGNNSCEECVDSASGTNTDLGCGGPTPLCAAGVCVECTASSHCDDGVACTADTCNGSGACVNTADDAACPYNATSGKCGSCDEVSGCEDGNAPVKQAANLLTSGNFDSGVAGWSENSTKFGPGAIISNYSDANAGITPHSLNYYAWLGGAEDDESTLTQSGMTLPAGTVQVEVTTHYWLLSTEADAGGDYMTGTLRANAGASTAEFINFTSRDTTAWTTDVSTIDVSDWSGNIVELEYYSFNDTDPGNDGHTHFLLDTLSLQALVCE